MTEIISLRNPLLMADEPLRMAAGEPGKDQTQSFIGLTSGAMVAHYQIVKKIGAGGMGEVYLSHDTRLNRKVALKFLSSHLSGDADCRRRFTLEAQAAAGLDHPNILTVYEVGDFKGRPFFSMQFLEGQSLREITSGKELPFEQALEIVIQICEGLLEAHSKNVIHRDLKPANVIISSSGRVKIVDFGLAKILGESLQTQTGSLIGTINYMSPEQVEGRAVDHRTDIFSAGVLFCELLTGVNPFARGSIPATIHAIVTEDPEDVFRYRHTIPGECQVILDRALAKSPDDRYQTINDFLSDLKALKVRNSELASSVTTRLYHAPAPVPARRPSIAVLPFVNMSPDPNNEYFAEGLSEELLSVLAKIGQLRVAARTSSFVFKHRGEDIRAIGKSLNVSAILEGSVRKSDNQVRITVQLVDAANGYHLWAETYDRTLDDIFLVQDDIARSVVKRLRSTLMGETTDSSADARAETELAFAVKGRGENAEAHRQYLRGQYLVERLTREDVEKATCCFRRAIEIDPLHALAWTGLSRTYADQAGHGWLPCSEGFERARAAAQRALEIEPDLAEGHLRLGLIHMSFDWDWQGALSSVKRAMELAPGSASVLRTAAHLASNLNQMYEAISLIRRVALLDPLSSTAHHSLGLYYYAADRLKEAEAAFETALELNSRQVGLRFDSARIYLAQGFKERALAEAEQEIFEPFRLLGVAVVRYALNNTSESDSAVEKLIEKYGEDGAYQIAEAYAFRGDTDQAFEWLERAYKQRDPGLPELRTEPLLRTLHGDPRWQRLLKGIGFAD